MLRLVDLRCSHLLCEEENTFLEKFRSLSKSAQAIYVRVGNRKGAVVKISSLDYDEISDLPTALEELTTQNFLKSPSDDLAREMLAAFTKPELLELLRQHDLAQPSYSGLSKPALVDFSLETALHSQIPAGTFVCYQCTEAIDYIRFLYFGRLRDGMQAFTLRDLGIVKTRDEADGQFRCIFPDQVTARQKFFYEKLSISTRSASSHELIRTSEQIAQWPNANENGDFDRAVARLGSKLERMELIDSALKVYQASPAHPSRERAIRILFKKDRKEEARDLLDQILENPDSDEELIFGEDFLARKFGQSRTGLLTDLLRSAPVIQIDEAFRDGAEKPAIEHFKQEGWDAWHTENWFWSTLFGIWFWDELQGLEVATTHNEFDIRPAALRDGTFYENQKEEIEAKLNLIGTPEGAAHLDQIFTKHFGVANGVFRWSQNNLLILQQFCATAPASAISEVLRMIAKNPKAMSTGYPDLLLIRKKEIRFVEVKAEGDQIRRHQLAKIRLLDQVGLDVSFARVQWFIDPDQTYVVVDIETTGGRAEYHRITEIGAVKIKKGKIIDRFTTLIDPERAIPRKITQLTGITDAMVKDQPKFKEIAEEFNRFTAGAVFVAHSARFDYGFIRQEYRLLSYNYRRPTLCTVVAMRKYFPGLSAYGLAPLCEEFGIDLTRHHRAMADAEATTELLALINEKRLAAQGASRSD